MKKLLIVVAIVVAIVVGVVPAWADSIKINKKDLADAWPLTVAEGLLACQGEDGVGAVTFAVKGVTYAVNGLARSSNKKSKAIDAIWASNSKIPGTKKDIGPLIERGLKLCK